MLNLPLSFRPGRRAFSLFAALALLAGAVQAQITFRPQKTQHYQPFSIKSSKLKVEVSDIVIMDRLMCRSTLDTMGDVMELVQNFDLLRTSPMDGSLTLTTFGGRQGGKPVEVSLAVQTSDRLLMHVMVDGQIAITCR